MTRRPSRVAQPGPAQAPRVVAVEGVGRAFSMRLEAGLTLLEATRRGFAAQGFTCGALNFGALALAPFAYVTPALSSDGAHAAFYSQTFRPAGVTRTEGGAMTFGRRDGAAFFHCHALWRQEDGRRGGGHVLPDETFLAESATVEAFGVVGATFEAEHDPETNFKLFGPVADAPREAEGARAFAVRVRPNECLHGALEGFARDRGLSHARIHGGVGSTIGAAFEDGRVVENFATEVFVRGGALEPDLSGALVARLDVGLVDHAGALAQGRLARGANPTLMTFELILS